MKTLQVDGDHNDNAGDDRFPRNTVNYDLCVIKLTQKN